MKYVEIAGKKAARIAFGSTNFGGKTPEGTARELLDTYWQAGGNYLTRRTCTATSSRPKTARASGS